jgi:conjugal transfer pilus assembly protein TraB
MAKNIFPIIEIDAGRKVDFVMIRGMSLQPKSKSAPGNNGQTGSRNSTASNSQNAVPNMIGFGASGASSRGVSAGMNGMGGMNSAMTNGQTGNNGFWPN